MKVLVTNYTFNASAKTVTFNSYSTIELNRLLLITNATRNTIIYNFASPALGGTVSGNTITLGTSTAGMTNEDKLQIFYENEDVPATDEVVRVLNRIAASLRGPQNVDSSDRQRVTVESVPQTVVTWNAIFDGIGSRELLYGLEQTKFGVCVRPLITQT
ncbi:MAG: hypothetical protein EBU90_02655 [Proteobacteria bacterium]|nr:hypothetical protein [Pseudomonadota bacterium]NBP13137.1 hypothetical protein [bacterium]